ncbi:YHYH protein [Wenyingzhuangia sp. 2_MG-2023]|uniref:YHYH protein n=1 Tax=Wenyingzhuangia sp. 2_MG-2023 TaxID=3062639 RepID=UPI0026E2FAD7|nr:YHYH protein [Wenyingzhuangia sp. 2_MG-2023]MDO6739400.1 YHYH protein [Wenyingzhuangia sp. 2_MG-2023]
MKNTLSIILAFTILISCKSNQGKKEQQRPNGQRPSSTQIISELDSNGDQKLSKNEVKGPIANDFTHIDSNNDGFLTLEELNKAEKNQGNRPPQQTTTNKDLSNEIDASVKVIPVNTDYFISENIIGGIQKQMIELNGVETLCYVMKTNSQATEHQMGPWCPRHIEDGMEKAGIWFKDDKVYDVSGHFIANLDEFYSDDKWKLYREDGTIRVTDTEEGCLAAAKPNVEDKYHNYCVECLPEYFKDQVTTFVIPATPKYIKTAQSFGRGGIGLAFNGVKYDPPAPTHAILAAHTIAPLDDHGGHVNPHGGYHYHAVTGSTKEIPQTDIHSPIIGYAIDGFGIYGLLDKKGNKPTALDECGGHSDDERGYHYHAGEPGGNQIIKCLHGLSGYTAVKE